MEEYERWLMEVNSSLQPRHGSLPFYSNLQHKVSNKDSHLCRQASQHSVLMLYQQLRKGSPIEATNRAGKQAVQHLRHDRLSAN